MREPWDLDLEAGSDIDAHAIVGATQRRALGSRRRWRQFGAVLWASFLGATIALLFVVLLPAEGWLPLDTATRAALAFAVLWLLAFIPALIAAVLAVPPTAEADDAAR
ncbi:hypothetical protein [Solimonas terrae]|uniref:Uncharacterized protein n=1 Tax=Solimonas terrae TaxID=1396819 RepID=A0A6M2BJQ9_9GAMM|nr:hypothetical protein [Solimonas terrae]NGY03192.1 hypothetical protein [Solimonas terrae]